jgi:hypothetical protein
MEPLNVTDHDGLSTVQGHSFDLSVEELRDLTQNVTYECVGSSGYWSSYWTGSCSCSCECGCSCSCDCDW